MEVLKMIYSAVVFSCVFTVVFGQFHDGIAFAESASFNSVASRGRSDIILVSPPGNCACKRICIPGPAPGGIDIRIINNGPSPIGCSAGLVLCCASPLPPPPPPSKCGVRKIDPVDQPVVGQASFGAYPWHAALLKNDPKEPALLGSGVLLAPSYVLTAAHKVSQFLNNPKGLIVRLGEWNGLSLNEPEKYEQSGVADVFIHPDFDADTLSNDVAILRLNGNMPIDDHLNINTACQPALPPTVGKRCWVSGWGRNKFENGGQYQKIMREVDVPIMDVDDCESILRSTRLGPGFNLDKESFMCAGGEIGKDACTGDGGSPLVCLSNTNQWHVVGLVAWGIGCGSNGVPGVYTNVYNFLPWINTVMSQ